jgi:hypothetical protein
LRKIATAVPAGSEALERFDFTAILQLKRVSGGNANLQPYANVAN